MGFCLNASTTSSNSKKKMAPETWIYRRSVIQIPFPLDATETDSAGGPRTGCGRNKKSSLTAPQSLAWFS